MTVFHNLKTLSGVTLTFAHHALRAGHRHQIIGWLVATIALGSAFLGFQIMEYGHAYHDGLKLTSGIYGSTFALAPIFQHQIVKLHQVL
jgi:cytochrome c oxidase subunit 3